MDLLKFLELPLTKWPDSVADRATLIEGLWAGPHSFGMGNHFDLSAYPIYYIKQCGHALHDTSIHLLVKKHGDIANIVHEIGQDTPRESIRTTLTSKLPAPLPANESQIIEGSIDLSARLISMMEFGELQHAFSGRKGLVWDQGTLKDFIHKYFDTPVVLGHDVKLEKMFKGRNLGRIAGIEIVWTDNLADHLRMIDEDKKVAVFQHATFLEYQQRSLFPPGFIEETLQTLALLFPEAEQDTARWFKRQLKTQHIDRQLVKCGRLKGEERQIERFQYWHDRLVVLKQTFDESRPTTLSQWWCDRRNGKQWYTFWVAIIVLLFTVFFGLIQCIEGGLQVYKTYHPS